ncbi:protein FAM185A [Octodon degus]|uniref:Protein FAM185A n=1 Tax=Octodon degus TaxID=10160 RepID=A0A6P6F6S7_OCTDE|nr:protein FAM185A [Octodon degus]XP_023580076.1 protein FAM185A [Octodon degus]XP_023580077.1 protein FAM185A [Octodon degus]
MFTRGAGRGFGRLWLGQLRAGPGAVRTTLSDSGAGGRRPGSEPQVPRPGSARRRAAKEWALRVSPFGRLRLRLPCRVAVRALDPLCHPDGDRVLVAACDAEGGPRGLASLQVTHDEALRETTIEADGLDPGASVEVDAPLRFDLNIKSSGSSCVRVQNMECDDCKIEIEQGTSFLQSVKSKKIHVQTKGGNVICVGTVYGNIDIRTSHQSSVTIDKLQGSRVHIATEDGLLEAKYLYTESSLLSSAAGDIMLGSVHGDIILQSETGNITVDSSAGCLKASTHQGAIDVYVSQLGNVELKSDKGSVTVKVPASLQASLQLSGKEVDVSPEVRIQDMARVHQGDGVTVTGLMNPTREQENWIRAAAPEGTVSFRSQTWFQSLKRQN